MKHLIILTISVLSVFAGISSAATLHLVWNPSNEEDLAGYMIYYSKTRGEFDQALEIDKANSYPVNGLEEGVTYFFAVKALDWSGNESDFSEQIEGVTENNPDQAPPYLAGISPGYGADGVSPYTTLHMDICDEITGVDRTSIQLIIDGTEVPAMIIGSPLMYSVTFIPPVPADWGSTHYVEISASDLAETPNTFTADFYFTVCTSNDTDEDELPDEWESWGHLDPNDGGHGLGRNGDPDRDLLKNIEEFEQGCDPTSPESILVGSGPGPANIPVFRVYNACGDLNRHMDIRAFCNSGYGLEIAGGDLDRDGLDEIIAGAGPGLDCPPQVCGFDANGIQRHEIDFNAYNATAWGVHVACGDIDGNKRAEIITGPGPSLAFGPHVRGWTCDLQGSSPFPGVSFFAYGTKKFGVKVVCGDVDGDGQDEILTGPGQGNVFGPHVRAFNYDNEIVTPIGDINFFSYGTRKYGVNVSCADLDRDDYAEIITGPGPGAVFGPHVRAFNYDNHVITPISSINFFAYNTKKYGVRILGADVDGDRYGEIVTAPGPSSTFGSYVRVWNYDGDEIIPCESGSFFTFPASKYGATLGKAQLVY